MKTPFHFDGHGINDADGNRLATISLNPYTHTDMRMRRNPEFDRLGNLLAASQELLDALRFANDLLANLTTESFQNGGDKPARERIAAAIAKAERSS